MKVSSGFWAEQKDRVPPSLDQMTATQNGDSNGVDGFFCVRGDECYGLPA